MGERSVTIEVAAAVTIMGVFDWVAMQIRLAILRLGRHMNR
jgi:hypothetical protein